MGKQFFQKKFLPFALTAAMLLPAVPAMAATNDLQGHWAEPTITEWQKKGLIQGYEDGSFKPNSSITRAEFIVLTNNAKGFTDEAKISFLDVKDGDWFYSAVAKAVAANYVKGYEDGTFHPNQTITRAEAAVILANITGLDANAAGADSFTDAAQIPAWAKGSVGAAAAAGYMSGYPDGSFGASAPITRAEAVSSLNRVLGAAETAKEDFIITEDGTVVKDKVITGNLIIEESVGDGDVYLENVTVEGETFVRGGGSHSVYVENSKFVGAVNVEKTDVHLGISGGTSIADMIVTTSASMTFDSDFDGEIAQVTVSPDNPNGKVIIEGKGETKQPINKLIVDSKSNISLNSNVAAVLLGEGAEDSEIEVKKNAVILHMEIQAKSGVSGEGTIHILDVGASGVTTTRGLTVEETTISNSAEAPIVKPSTAIYGGGSMGGSSSSSSSSSGGGSSRPSKPSVTIEPHMQNYNTNTDKFVSFNVNGATLTREDMLITVKSEKDGTTTILTEDTNYSVGILGGTITVTFLTFAGDTKYIVEIKASGTGSSKYDITPYTYRYDGLNKVTWQATTEGTEDIIPGTEITAETAKAIFTVDGATTNNREEEISATLQGATQSEAIPVPSSNITTVSGSKTVTVDLGGLRLPADTYTLTFKVHGYRLDTEGNRYAPETDTVTTTFTVTEKLVAMGKPTSNFTEITSGATLPTGNDVLSIAFPMTGVTDLARSGENAPDVTITPTGSGIGTLIGLTTNSTGGKDVYVELRGTKAPTVTEDTTYTVTLTIPKAGITVVPGYTDPEPTTADLTKTFTFTVKPAPTTTPVTAEGNGDTVILTAGAAIPTGTTLTLDITGASALATENIKVFAFQGDYSVEITSSAVFTEPTEGNTGKLVLTLSGTAPEIADGGLSYGGNGLKVVIPKEAFTPMDGYTLPSDNITVRDFKFALNPATTPTGE